MIHTPDIKRLTMNRFAIFHQPESRYAYPPDGHSLRIILRVAAGEKFEKIELVYNNKYDFTKSRSTAEMFKCAECGAFDYYKIDLRLTDVRLAYIFRIYEADKIWYFSEDGLSEDYDIEYAYYSFFQFPFINGADVPRIVDWTNRAVFYQIFIDRFSRGDFEKDDGYINQPWNMVCSSKSYTGGDLKGIVQKLGYLSELGINALYLTPIFKADSNHKYNVCDYLTVDPQFGGNGALKELLDEAHARGIKVVEDAVLNHCDKSHAFFRDVLEKGKDSEYYGWFMIDGDLPVIEKGNFAHFADCRYMPKWNTNQPFVRRYLVDVALEYLGMGFDGLRLDVADELSHEFLRQLRREVKERFPDALLIGEIWHDNRHWLRGDQLDGVMNYKLQKILADYFGVFPISADKAAERMNALLLMNTEQANAMALNFLDNHDTPRFFRFTGGNKDKLLGALCAMVMFPGMPCVFYGTELPIDGGGDPDCRQTFDWDFSGRDELYKERFEKILSLKNERALVGGCAEKITAQNGVLVIVRQKDGERVTAYFNTCGKTRRLDAAGEVLFSMNRVNGKLMDNGVLVVKEMIL